MRRCFRTGFFLVLALLLCNSIPLLATENTMPESEIQTIIKYLKAGELKYKLRGLLFAHRTLDKRVFDQLVKMYEVNNDIRENVYRAMLRLNQEAKGKFSVDLVNTVNKEIDRLKREAPYEVAGYISSFLGHIVLGAPDQHLNLFVESVVANLNDLCGSSGKTRDEVERNCNIYFAAQGNEPYIEKLAARFNMPSSNKQDAKIIEIFIARKDPRIFNSLIAEINSNNKPTVFFVELVMKYAKEINQTIPKEIIEKMQSVIDKFDTKNASGEGSF